MNKELYMEGMTGCSDGGCIFQDNRRGMHTNGGCNCMKELSRTETGRKAVRLISYLRRMAVTKENP
jgi:hypothetical protein